jgi:mannose-1-phosphate guanylyltransferase
MSDTGVTWAIVLAAGDGRRLHSLTTNASGMAVPKQFCSLRGGYSLLRDALFRAQAFAHAEHVCTIVAEQHRQWWRPALGSTSEANIIVQPRNCGTAHGILLPLLHIMRRDPEARVVLLPSDHHVDDERALAVAIRRSIHELERTSRRIVLLGISPEQADPDLGYVVPGEQVRHGLWTVARFVEKPRSTRAQRLIESGALWNSFIMVGRAGALLEVFQARIPETVENMREAIACDLTNSGDSTAMADLYRRLTDMDFSKHVLEGAESMLRVMAVPRCGWSDLGTPTRLAETLKRLPRQCELADSPPNPLAGFLNLSQQHAALEALRESAAPNELG